jgi:N-acetylglucosaminyldiphosphoundecaprenol N-acetyl-beta-D-mannosaminyltransferase
MFQIQRMVEPMSTFLPIANSGVRSFEVLGCKVHAVTAPDLTDLVESAVDSHESCIIANHNLHSVYLFQRDAKLRDFFSKAKWIHVDGMGIVLLAKATGVEVDRSSRVTYVDWIPLLMKRAIARNWRVYYLGSKPGVADKGLAILRDRFPGLNMEVAHGYFDQEDEENVAVLEKIHAFSPDVLMVGMGMPRQECWIVDNLDRLGPVVLLPCGASIDYVAGEIPTPPRWAGRCGLEWLYRLVAEPDRLWKRYLVEPWGLLLLIGARWLQNKTMTLHHPTFPRRDNHNHGDAAMQSENAGETEG